MGEQATITGILPEDVVETLNSSGEGEFVLVCEHASNQIPEYLNNLGLSDEESHSHIAWDPGAREVAHAMSTILDSPLVASRISRLVYDCNRDEGAPDAVLAKSDEITIPGNAGLSKADIKMRAEQIYDPFCNALKTCIENRLDQVRAVTLVTIHSFTPVLGDELRELDLGVLHDTDSRLADEILHIAGGYNNLNVRRNTPYRPQDGVTHTLVKHAISHGILNVMFEIRNDLIAGTDQQNDMARRLSTWVLEASSRLNAIPGKNIKTGRRVN